MTKVDVLVIHEVVVPKSTVEHSGGHCVGCTSLASSLWSRCFMVNLHPYHSTNAILLHEVYTYYIYIYSTHSLCIKISGHDQPCWYARDIWCIFCRTYDMQYTKRYKVTCYVVQVKQREESNPWFFITSLESIPDQCRICSHQRQKRNTSNWDPFSFRIDGDFQIKNILKNHYLHLNTAIGHRLWQYSHRP